MRIALVIAGSGKRLDVGSTGVIGNLIPVVAYVISYLVLGERFAVTQMAGVTVAGVWMVRSSGDAG